MLRQAGALIGKFLIALFVVKLVIVLFQFMIPTEATIIETLAAYPIAMLLVLFFYVKYARD